MKKRLLLCACLGTSVLSFGQDIGKIGVNRFIHAVGTQNTSVGLSAGASLTPGTSVTANTFMGYSAGFSNAGGNENSFFGSSAGFSNSSGKSNTFNGYLSGYNNTSGNTNAFIGSLSGYKNTTGYYGTFVGPSAGYSNTTGFQNTFVGLSAGYFSLTGSNNTFIGAGAGENNNSGGDNVFLGFRAGYANSAGSGNIALGSNSGGGDGFLNISIGQFSGSGGTKNIFLGYQTQATGPNSTSITNSVAIGTNARVSMSNAIVLGDTVGASVGIGTTRPTNRLEIRSFAANTAGLRFTNLTSSSPTIAGTGKALSVNALGDIILVPSSSSASTHSDSVWVRSTGNTYYTGNGNVGIGTSTPAYKLDINGDINLSSSNKLRMDGKPFIATTPYSNTATILIGYEASSAGPYNVVVGNFAGATASRGDYNMFLGYYAGHNNQSGRANAFLGPYTGNSNTTGSNNVYIGLVAGASNTTGNSNTFLGSGTGSAITSGSYNVYMGAEVARINSIGGYNTLAGYFSGYSLQNSSNNTFYGSLSGTNAGSGQNNTFFGFKAGYNVTSGSNNIIIGPSSGTNVTTGDDNVLMGYNTSMGNGSGQFNIIIGPESGGGDWSGKSNMLIGYHATAESPYLENATAIGADAHVTVSNAVILGNQANVGIGTSAPTARLEVVSESSDASGLRLTNLTSQSYPTQSTNQFLTVNEKGDVVKANYQLRITSPNEWSDKVFSPNYQLHSLASVANYIKQKGHLPGVPSAAQVTREGVDLTKMNAILLEKIEELTLYSIQLEKANQELQKQRQQDREELQNVKQKQDQLEKVFNQLLKQK